MSKGYMSGIFCPVTNWVLWFSGIIFFIIITFPSYMCKFFQDIGEHIGSNSNKIILLIL